MRFKLPASAQNWISLIGATIALISFFMIVFLFTITTVISQQSSYIGLVIYILLPSVLVTGLILIPIGMLLSIRKRHIEGEGEAPPWPRIDLNDVRHRNAFFIFTIGSAIFLFASAIGSYETFHFTESVTFCGTLCHGVMQPEYTAYQSSPHARVACVACHVGEGADWYVRSKLSGLYQVYSVLADKYPRPIPTPIHNLRPARETCEKCHWPQKFYAKKLRNERHYLNDEENTQWDIVLNMRIGAEHSAMGLKEGIHWHINPDVKIEYLSTDEEKEEMLWIRKINLKTNDTLTFVNSEDPVDSESLDLSRAQVMDCMDCHNRPSHSYKPPTFFVNEAITAGRIPQSLPEIKSLAMEICGADYPDIDSANTAISKQIREFYADNYPEISEENPALLNQAIEGLQYAYGKNIFPEMKVRWDAYPNHIGHMEFNGCFRCHNDSFAAGDQVISKDCNLCHQIMAQGSPDEREVASYGQLLEFKHPVDIDGAWKESLCTDCHTGLNP